MSAEAKALLDELMGRSRNLDPSQQPQDISWNSDDVCKYFLCGFCPHELFTNTRADLGPCNKIHDDAFKKEYEKSPKFERCGFEEDFMRFLQSLISDVEKRIRRGHQRLALNSQQGTLTMNGLGNQQEEKVTLLTEKINELVEQAEELGCQGKVEEAQGVMKLVDQLKEERQDLEKQPVQEESPMMKQMEVCDVCGAFLIVGDAPQRQDEHLMGKQHAGYAQVRAEIDRRKKKVRDAMEAREATEAKFKLEREEREKERQRERDERRKKEKDRERDRDRGRRRRSSSRNRDRRRSRSRDRKRSSSGDKRRKRSGSRDRRRGQRSKSRDREKDRDRRRRSRSNSKSHKSSRSSRRSSSRDRRSGRKSSWERSSRDRHRSRSKERKRRSSQDKDKEKESKHSSSNHKAESRDNVRTKDKNYAQGKEVEVNGGKDVGEDNREKNETMDEGEIVDDAQERDTESSIPMQVDETGDSVNGTTKDCGQQTYGHSGPTLSEGDTKIDE